MTLLSIGTWFSALSSLEKTYWVFALVFSFAFIVQLLISFFAGGVDDIAGEGDVDMEVEGDHGIGFQFFTVKNMIAFFTIFGWVGLGCLKADMSPALTILCSVISGLIMMVIIAAIFYYASKLVHSGTLKMSNAINQVGEVYLTIPAERAGYGKVQIKIQGSLHELDAVTDDATVLKNGTLVTVTQVLNDQILIVTKHVK